MGMAVNEIAVTMRVRVNHHRRFICRDRRLWHGTHEAEQIPTSKHDQHEANGKFHRQTGSNWNHQIKKNDGASPHKNRQSVAKSPKDTNQGCPLWISLLADDGAHRDDVIRIGGMPHPEKKTN